MYRRRPARRRKPTDDGQAEPSYSCGEQLAARERRWPWRESSLCRARLVSPVVVSINKGSLLLCEKGVCAPWHKTCRSTKEVPNFRERRQREVRRITLPETVWKRRTGSISWSREPAQNGRKGTLFGASRLRHTRDPTRPATFQTVSPRTPLNKSCAPVLLGAELAPELPRSHRLESDQRTH